MHHMIKNRIVYLSVLSILVLFAGVFTSESFAAPGRGMFLGSDSFGPGFQGGNPQRGSAYYDDSTTRQQGHINSFRDTINMNWTAQWHNPNNWIAPGSNIKAKEVAESLQYLYDQFSKLNLQGCTAVKESGVACKFKRVCNCGKYGCSICEEDSIKDIMTISCPGNKVVTLDGPCADPREVQQCGKYGCTSN